jgi:hypothetical protein
VEIVVDNSVRVLEIDPLASYVGREKYIDLLFSCHGVTRVVRIRRKPLNSPFNTGRVSSRNLVAQLLWKFAASLELTETLAEVPRRVRELREHDDLVRAISAAEHVV